MTPPAGPRPGSLPRFVAWVRDSWLILGLALALILGLEAVLRIQGAVRSGLGREQGGPPHPYADSAWFDGYLAEDVATRRLAWRPYVYFRRQPYQGTYINVDSAGLRRTVQPPAGPDARPIFFFGGSTMFGTWQRDAATIPSLMAARLADLGVHDVRATNFGETGYVFTQSVLELLLQLRGGARPHVVVFYDGINDVFSTVQNGVAGLPQNEWNRAREFELGRTVYAWERDLATDLRAWGRAVQLGAMRLRLFARFQPRQGSATRATLDVDAAASDLVTVYSTTARFVEALAVEFGFTPIYVWQPNLQTTTKPLAPLEQGFARDIDADPLRHTVRALHDVVPARLEVAMADIAPGRFLDLRHVFDNDSATVFVDLVGHVTEEANRRIVEAMLPAITAQLDTPAEPATR